MVLDLIVAVLVRLPALYLALYRGRGSIEPSTLIILAVFSAFLGYFMPASLFDIAGLIFRVAIFALIVMVMARKNVAESFMVVFVAAFIESVIIFVLSISPLAFLVAGMSPITIP